MSDFTFSFGANASGFNAALIGIRQSVSQSVNFVKQEFSTVNSTLNETRNKFVMINNTVANAASSWERLAAASTAIRNSFRILTEVASGLSAPFAQFSRFEDAATRLAPLTGGLEKAKELCGALRDEAANGTMSFEQLASVAGRLATVFKSADDVRRWTTAFHDLSAGTGLDVNELVGNFVRSRASFFRSFHFVSLEVMDVNGRLKKLLSPSM